MPEGHTIHRLARDLNKTLAGTPVESSSPQGRFSEEAALLDGQRFRSAEAWGKHLFLDVDNAPLLHVHLGLIGKFRQKPADTGVKGAIRLRLIGAEKLWDLTGPMVCAFIDPDDRQTLIDGLGPDPLRSGADRDVFRDRLLRKRMGLSAALLDQKVIAGIGNVYRSEFCFLTGIHPETPADSLQLEQADELWDMAVAQLKVGLRLNRIVTRDPDEVGMAAGRISGDDRLYVYKRDGRPCHRCGDEIRLIETGQRKAWYCPTCQA